MARAGSALDALRVTNPDEYERIVAEQRKYAFTPHSAGQKAVLDDPSRFIVVRAGRRYGKTKVAARKLIRKMMRAPSGSVGWWVANTYKNTRRGYREVLRQLPPQFLAKPAPPATANDLILTLKNGTRIEFYSGTNPDAMAGEGVFYVVIDEAALQSEVVWQQTIRPTLMDHGGGALLISTPRGRNWFWRAYRRGEDPMYKQYSSYHFTTMDNPLIGAEEIEEARDSLPDTVFQQEILAEFIAGAGSIFVVGDELLVAEPQPIFNGDQIIMGVDLAKHQDFTVLTAARVSDRMPVYHDRFNSIRWGRQKEMIVEAVEGLEAQGSAVSIAVDSTGVGDVITDDLEDLGLDVIPITFSLPWKQKAVNLLAADLEHGRARILERQLFEFESYEYTITDAGRFKYSAPEGGHDDEVSAKLLEHWAMTHETLGSNPVKPLDLTRAVVDDEIDQESDAPEGPVGARSAEDLMNDPNVWN